MVAGLGCIGYFTPRYKITRIDEKNFLITEQTSPLFKRTNGEVRFHIDKIVLYSSVWIVTGAVLLIALKGKDGRNIS